MKCKMDEPRVVVGFCEQSRQKKGPFVDDWAHKKSPGRQMVYTGIVIGGIEFNKHADFSHTEDTPYN